MDEESTKSDEEYDDLAMQDIQENGYLPDDDAPIQGNLSSTHGVGSNSSSSNREEKYRQNLDRFLRTENIPTLKPQRSYSSTVRREGEKSEKKVTLRIRRRSQSIPSLPLGKDGSLLNGLSFSEAAQV